MYMKLHLFWPLIPSVLIGSDDFWINRASRGQWSIKTLGQAKEFRRGECLPVYLLSLQPGWAPPKSRGPLFFSPKESAKTESRVLASYILKTWFCLRITNNRTRMNHLSKCKNFEKMSAICKYMIIDIFIFMPSSHVRFPHTGVLSE